MMFVDLPGESFGRRRVARGDGGDQLFLLGVMDFEGIGREIFDDALDNVVVGGMHFGDLADLAGEFIQKTPVLDMVAFQTVDQAMANREPFSRSDCDLSWHTAPYAVFRRRKDLARQGRAVSPISRAQLLFIEFAVFLAR